MVGILEAEGEADQGRHRSEGDVALHPVQAQAEHFAAIDRALLDDALGLGRRRIRSRFGSGQGETRNFLAVGEAFQIAVLLRLGAVMHQQLAGPERVRHHHGHRGSHRTARNACDDARLGQRGKTVAAVFLRDDQAEQPVLADQRPDFGRQVAVLIDLPVIDRRAQFIDWAVEEGLLVIAERARLEIEQLLPVRHAGEQVGIPPHGPGLEGHALGVAEPRQHLGEDRHDKARYQGPAQRRQAEHEREQDQARGHCHEQRRRSDALYAPAEQQDRCGAGPGKETKPAESEDEYRNDRQCECNPHERCSSGRPLDYAPGARCGAKIARPSANRRSAVSAMAKRGIARCTATRRPGASRPQGWSPAARRNRR